MKRYAGVLLLALAVTGCGTPGPVQTYEGPARPASEVAILKGTSVGGLPTVFNSYMWHGAWPREFTELRSHIQNYFEGYPNEVHLLPGTYSLLLGCTGVSGYGPGWGATFTFFAPLQISLIGGMTYEFGCSQPGGYRGKVEFFLHQSFPTAE